MEGDRSTEAEIHGRFAHLRFGRTEQFRPEPDLMTFINRPLFAAAGDVVGVEVMKPEVKPVRLDMTERGHRLLRLVAAYEDKSMAVYARETLESILEQRAKEMGLKI